MRDEVVDMLGWAIEALRGGDAPRLTAEALLAHTLGVSRTQLLSRPPTQLPPPARARFEALVQRAARGEPLAYLTGQREFYGLAFAVSPEVLVPRPETELLVERALQALPAGQPAHVLDVGTGSGCIAITLAVHRPLVRVTAVDLSPAALDLARRNARRHAVQGRLTFLHSDLLAGLSQAAIFDLMCANLPYIPSAELAQLDVARHEPCLALDGGRDGLELVRRLLGAAPGRLRPGGRLLLEIGAGQGAAVASLARAAFPAASVGVQVDLAGLERIVEIAS